MHRHSRLKAILLSSVYLLFFVSCWGCATSETTSGGPGKSGGSKGFGGAATQSPGDSKGSCAAAMGVPYYPPPARMDLCGEPVPLQNQEVLERFDREFTLIVYNHAQVYLWLKRMERYFPWIEERLRHYGLPDDLKYVAVVESDLMANACSPKGAAGPWQFMPATGSAYGLSQTEGCDERYDFERATECAFRYLNDLYKRYRNWTVAIATYNCGDKRILEQMRTTRDYYEMRLPTETERYVLRILAVKAVLGNPIQYGYNLPKGQGYPPFKVDRVNVSLSCPLPMHSVAEASGTTVRELKRLNPAFRSEQIPKGSQEIKVPEGQGKGLERNLESVKGRSATTVESSGAGENLREDDDEATAVQSRPFPSTTKKKSTSKATATAASKQKPSDEKNKPRKAAVSKAEVGPKKPPAQPGKPQEKDANKR